MLSNSCQGKRGRGGMGNGRVGCCSKVKPKCYAAQCSFPVCAFLPLTLHVCANRSDTTLMYPIVNELKNVTMLFLTDIRNSMLLLKSHQGKVQIPCEDSAQFFGIIYVL